MKALKELWQNLNEREKWIAATGGALLLLFLLFFLIWQPLTHATQAHKKYVSYQQSLLNWMERSVDKIKELKRSNITVTQAASNQLLSIVDTTLQKTKLKPYVLSIGQSNNQTNNVGNGGVLLKFKDIPFDDLVTWLSSLWKTHGIRVAHLSVTPNQVILGAVSGEVVLNVGRE